MSIICDFNNKDGATVCERCGVKLIIESERKPARPFPTHHLRKAFDKESNNTIPIITGIIIIGLFILWTILGAV